MIFLDMDGVLVDFIGGACEVHKRDRETVDCWDFMVDKWGMTHDEFWEPINNLGSDFWSHLAPYPWCYDLVDLVESTGKDFYFCTTPSRSPDSLKGKLEWLQEHMGSRVRNWIMTTDKHLLAKKGRTLIDDSMDNCSKFSQYGGNIICFPRPWNFNNGVEDGFAHTKQILGSYYKLEEVEK